MTRDRGVKGVQWAVRGALTGSMEIWLEPVGDGTVVHWFLRADPPEAPRPGARAGSTGSGTPGQGLEGARVRAQGPA